MGAPRGIKAIKKNPAEVLIGSVLHFMCREENAVQPLLERFFNQGFTLEARRPAKQLILSDVLDDVRTHPARYAARLLTFTRARGGRLTLLHHGRDLLHLTYDDDWSAAIAFDFLDDKSIDLLAVQDGLFAAFTAADVAAIIDLCADYLVEHRTAPFTYELTAAAGTFLQGCLNDGVLCVEMRDLFVYLRLMLFLLRKNITRVMVKSPVDVMRLAEQGRHTVKHLALAYQQRELLLIIELCGSRVLELGRGVKPLLGSRFGPTSIRLSALAGLFKAMRPGKGS